MPAFPPALRAIVLRPKVVEVRVSIDQTGKVIKAEAIPQRDLHKLFVDAALNAARLWKFRPARIGDQPVPAETVLQFSFNPTP
jgi:TonB family protein